MVFAAAAVASMALAQTTVATAPAPASELKIGDKAPALQVAKWLKGTPVKAFEPGKVYVVEFWATWCGPCKQSIPHLTELQKKYAGKVKFVGVAVSVNQSPERVKLYAAKHGLPFDVLYDRKGHATDAYEVPATSYIVVIDGKGTVVYTGVGADQDIDAAIRKAL